MLILSLWYQRLGHTLKECLDLCYTCVFKGNGRGSLLWYQAQLKSPWYLTSHSNTSPNQSCNLFTSLHPAILIPNSWHFKRQRRVGKGERQREEGRLVTYSSSSLHSLLSLPFTLQASRTGEMAALAPKCCCYPLVLRLWRAYAHKVHNSHIDI